nr:hypothetical protein BgiMline_006912 [Biomphalaria glabrata]
MSSMRHRQELERSAARHSWTSPATTVRALFDSLPTPHISLPPPHPTLCSRRSVKAPHSFVLLILIKEVYCSTPWTMNTPRKRRNTKTRNPPLKTN